jgi:hypothetical protein
MDQIDWLQLKDLLRKEKCTPIVSHALSQETLFGGQDVFSAWAEQERYPLADKDNVARVAQYMTVLRRERPAKMRYLNFIRQTLLAQVQSNLGDEPFLTTLQAELEDLTVSQVAERLNRLQSLADLSHPFHILAGLPVRVYLTTGYYDFLERALRLAGKEPVTDYYRWSERLKQPGTSLDKNFQPTIERPLVYHLHGVETNVDSMVLTEDNYFEFFDQFSHDLRDQNTSDLPNWVRYALSRSTLLLLGYDIRHWAFRVLFRGEVKKMINQNRDQGLPHVAIQLQSNPAEGITDTDPFAEYLNRFFAEHTFSVFWGNSADFLQTLWQKYQG